MTKHYETIENIEVFTSNSHYLVHVCNILCHQEIYNGFAAIYLYDFAKGKI